MAKKDKVKVLPVSKAAPTGVIALLNARLADAVDLKSQIKQAHWNVKGPEFIALHELFDSIAGHVDDQADSIAERAVQLGGVASGTIRLASDASSLPEYPSGLTDGKAHTKALVERVSAFAASVRAAIDSSDNAGDKVTADLFTRIGGEVEKDLWFLEAHLG